MMKNVRGTKRSTGSLRHLFVSAVVLMLLAVLFVAPAAAETTCDHTTWTAWGDDEAEKTSFPTESGNYYLVSNITDPRFYYQEYDREINICLNGYVISGEISVDSNVILNIYDCDKTTKHYFSVADSGMWILDPNGEKVLTGGVIHGLSVSGVATMNGGNIVGNSGRYTGGVVVDGGDFTLNNGNIVGNNATQYETSYGGGVHVSFEGTFIMNGGTIANNTGSIGGGVHMYGGTFIMNGGTIANNTGGGVILRDENAVFTLNNGSIINNNATSCGGVFVQNGKFKMTGGLIEGNTGNYESSSGYSGGGVLIYGGSFDMGGGTVSKNSAPLGGGIYLKNAVFNMTGGMIQENTAYSKDSSGGSGAGIYIEDATVTMSAGSITGNTAEGSAGGVYAGYGTFTMTGGSITGNTAMDGGGVYVSMGDFTMTNGTISGNVAERWGSGVYTESNYYSGTFQISDKAKITIDNDVYLSSPLIVTGDTFTGEVKSITGNGVVITEGYNIVQLNSSTLKASSIKDCFALKGTHTGLVLVASADDKNLTIAAGSSGGGEVIPPASARPQVNKTTLKINPYNTTTVNITFALTNDADADRVSVNLLSADGSAILTTKSTNKKIPAGSMLPTLQFTTLSAGESYKFNITLTNTTNNVDTRLTIGEAYISPSIDSITVTGLPAGNTLYLQETGTLSAVAKNGTRILQDEPVIWESLNKDVLEINAETGVYTAKGEGNAKVTATAVHGNLAGTIEITVIGTAPEQPPLPFTPAKDTRAQLSAVTAAEVKYSVTPAQFVDLTAPTIVHGKSSLLMTNISVMKNVGGVETKVPASVNADGTITITGSIDDADSLSVAFLGSTLGDVTNDGKPDTLDAARILQASAKLYTLDTDAQFYGDVSADGDTNTLDAARILQYSAKLTDNNYNLVS